MPGYIVQVGAAIQCPHAAQATITPSNQRVKAGGMAVALVSDQTTVTGCPFQVPVGAGTKPQPCIKVMWQAPATRVKVSGQPVLLQSSTGSCLSAEQIPQGPPVIATTQFRVKAV
ncbi:hypothetical protein ACFT30_08345 [Microbacterium ureisolvens]|uniref:hypothetical protein n=1 Tax=Microbacterium ureisolvens TaxID=2781186 RepID=UPI00362781C1